MLSYNVTPISLIKNKRKLKSEKVLGHLSTDAFEMLYPRKARPQLTGTVYAHQFINV